MARNGIDGRTDRPCGSSAWCCTRARRVVSGNVLLNGPVVEKSLESEESWTVSKRAGAERWGAVVGGSAGRTRWTAFEQSLVSAVDFSPGSGVDFQCRESRLDDDEAHERRPAVRRAEERRWRSGINLQAEQTFHGIASESRAME